MYFYWMSVYVFLLIEFQEPVLFITVPSLKAAEKQKKLASESQPLQRAVLDRKNEEPSGQTFFLCWCSIVDSTGVTVLQWVRVASELQNHSSGYWPANPSKPLWTADLIFTKQGNVGWDTSAILLLSGSPSSSVSVQVHRRKSIGKSRRLEREKEN